MLRMHVTQAEFRSFNEVRKQIAYACMCFLISSSFFFGYTFSISSTAPEEACHYYFSDVKERSIFFSQLRHKNLMTLEIYMIYNSESFLSLTCCIRKHGSSLDATRMIISRRSTTVC